MKPLLLAAGLAFAGVASADEAPDTSSWQCRFCESETATEAWVMPTLGFLSDSSTHFGDFTGLDDDGLLLDVSGALRYRDAESGYGWDASATNLALDSRSLGIEGGQQGSYDVNFSYAKLEHLVDGDTRSPFRTTGGALMLPDAWETAGSTQLMSELDNSLQESELGLRRERWHLGLSVFPHDAAELRLDYRRDDVEGVTATGASFLTLASRLPAPVDQRTDRFDVTAAYRHALGSVQLGFYSSYFMNALDAQRWQNPFNPIVPGAVTGERAVAPDNQAQRLSLGLASAPNPALQASARFSMGRFLQNDAFRPGSANPDLATPLPRRSLDGEVETLTASGRVSWRPGWKLRVVGDMLHDVRDNRTPVATYTQVVMDTFEGEARTNIPYGYTRDRLRLQIRRASPVPLALGVEQDVRKRDPSARGRSTDQTLWAQAGGMMGRYADLKLRVEHAERDIEGVAPLPGAADANPLAQTFDVAHRVSDELRGDLRVMGGTFSGGVNASVGRNHYPDARIGRTRDREFGFGADFGLRLSREWSVDGWMSRQRLETNQAGSQLFAVPDWFATQDDVATMAGVRGSWLVRQDLDLGADYVYSASDGTVALVSGGTESAFPALVTRWHDARIFARWALRDGLNLRVDLRREIYRAEDWANDEVEPSTVPNLLALGAGTREGSVTALFTSLRYDF